ncbi:hypothetical protein [Spirosoma validum]|uniref:Uncharacterized protein n=1 Tax=Spirosoma validum TaxID=2771355 RepID=A0A927B4Y9_9BACT|nr:hypothetical protein [Spirosoma validum]MBD2755356.1 hypothetical protein [Spirosoma validum]
MLPQTNTTPLRDAFDFFTNYQGKPNQNEKYQTKLADLTRGPGRWSEFQNFLHYFLAYYRAEKGVTACSQLPDVLNLSVQKKALLRTLDYFERGKCLNIKICFGLDECMIPQLIVSGSFYYSNKALSISLVDNPYKKEVSGGNGSKKKIGHYVLNFGRQLSLKVARDLLKRFEAAVTSGLDASNADLRGYSLDIKTFKLLLTDSQYLGKAKDIVIRMGMNNDGLDDSIPSHSGRVRIMLLEFADAKNSAGKSFYMCAGSVKDDSDPTECPPRQPCNATID